MCMSIVRVVVRRGSSCQTCKSISSRETGVPALRARQASKAASRVESLHRRPPWWQTSRRVQSTMTFEPAKPLAKPAGGRALRIDLNCLPDRSNSFRAERLFITE